MTSSVFTPGTRVKVIREVLLMDGDANGRLGAVECIPGPGEATVYEVAVQLDGNKHASYFMFSELELAP